MKKFRMFSVLAMALVLLISTSSALALEQQQIQRTIVNPVLLRLGVLNTSNEGRFASSDPAPATTASTTPVTVSSYQEYKLVMANALREKQKVISIRFSPNISVDKWTEWEQNVTGYWFDFQKEDGYAGDLFKEAPWIEMGWSQFNSSTTEQNGLVAEADYEVDYPYSSQEENSFEKELLQKERETISSEMNDYKREKTIHDWIVNHVEYDDDTLNGSDDLGYSDYSAFERGLAVCSGYASLADRMLAMAGMGDQVVIGLVGTGDTADTHAWNLTRLCGKWYHVDTTWDDPGENYGVFYGYFNLSDAEISESRDWIRKFYPAAPRPFDQNCEWATAQPRCSLFHPELCKNEMTCIRISGHWCSNQCQMKACAQPVPQPVLQPVPSGQNILKLTGSEIAKAPVYLGDIATGGSQMELSLNFPAYVGTVDEYVAIQIPNGTLFLLGPDGKLTTRFVAYAMGVTVAQRKTISGPFNVYRNGQAIMPSGQWIVYSLVCPTSDGGNLADYELMYYSFIIHP